MKTNPEREKRKKLEKKKFIFLQIGFIITLAAVLVAFEWKSEMNRTLKDYGTDREPDIIQIEITEQPKEKKPEPEKPKPQITEIEITKKDEEAEDVEIDAEGTQNDENYEPELEKEENVPTEIPFVPVPEVSPEFPGGMKALYRYLGDNIVFTKSAKRMQIKGTVYVYFVVEADGSISNIDLKRTLGFGLDEAVLKAIENMPRWKPGMQGNMKARVPITIPVEFDLR